MSTSLLARFEGLYLQKEGVKLKEIKAKQADKVLEILNHVEFSCQECILYEPCEAFRNKTQEMSKKQSICGLLIKLQSEGEKNEY